MICGIALRQGWKECFFGMFNFLNWRGSEVKTISSFCLVAFVFRLTWKTLKMSPEAPTRNRTYDNFFAQTHMWRTNIEKANKERWTVVSFVLFTQCEWSHCCKLPHQPATINMINHSHKVTWTKHGALIMPIFNLDVSLLSLFLVWLRRESMPTDDCYGDLAALYSLQCSVMFSLLL